MKNTQRSGAIWAFLAKITGTALGLIFNVVMARAIGPSGIGIYFLALAVVGIGATIARFGLDMAVLRFASVAYQQEDKRSLSALVRQSFVVIGAVGIVVTSVAWFLLPYIPLGGTDSENVQLVVSFTILAIVPIAAIRVLGQFLKAGALPGWGMFIQAALLQLLLVIGAVIVSAKESISVLDFGVLYLICTVLAMLIGLVAVNIRMPLVIFGDGDFNFRLLLKTSMPLLWVASMSMVINWSDVLMLGVMADSETVGLYGIASRVAALLTFVLAAVNSVTAPRFAKMHADGKRKKMEQLAKSSAMWMVIVSLPAVVIFWVFPGIILELFGTSFSDGVWILRILVIGQFVSISVGSVGTLLMMSGHERLIRNNTVLAIVVNLSANLLLIPIFGAVGAAMATALAYIVQNVVLWWKVRKVMQINTLFFLR